MHAKSTYKLVGDPVLECRQVRHYTPLVTDVLRDEHGRHMSRCLDIEPGEFGGLEVNVQPRFFADEATPLYEKLHAPLTIGHTQLVHHSLVSV